MAEDKNKLKAVRCELARLARIKKARTSQWTQERPNEWRPQQIIDPRTGSYFTPPGAWEFVAEKLEDDNVIVTQVDLHHPQGEKGYEFHVDTVYIKVQFGRGGTIIGRSFHD